MTEMKFRLGDRVALKLKASRTGDVCEVDTARRRYRIQWSDKRTWIKESSLIRVDRDPKSFYEHE